MTWKVYGLLDPRDKSIFYVGMTIDLFGRLRAHKSDPASAAWSRCREIAEAGREVDHCVFGLFEEKLPAKILEGRLILSVPGLVNAESAKGLPSSVLYAGWNVLEIFA